MRSDSFQFSNSICVLGTHLMMVQLRWCVSQKKGRILIIQDFHYLRYITVT